MEAVACVTNKLHDSNYVDRHKSKPTAFSRIRKLTFSTIFILILRNSIKSIQLVLNEFILDTNKDFSITAGAFCRARKKLLHTAYVELNEDIIDIYYRDNDIKRFKGYRLLAFDASKITLPNTQEIKKEFGTKKFGNQIGNSLGEYSSATYEACYDLLNNIAVQSSLNPCISYEADLAEKMVGGLEQDDIAIYDRGYASYLFMAALFKNNKNFIIRCPRTFITAVRNMFESDSPDTMIVTVNVPAQHSKEAKNRGLPLTIKIRLSRVILSTGEIEVLATSLFDSTKFCNNTMKELYGLRWGVETFFSKIKGRLGLENFTGKTVESINQDFWSTIFISNLETIMTEKTEEKINSEKPIDNKQLKINKAVSFNAIKKMAFEIFLDGKDKDIVLEKLDNLFRMNPIVVRNNRKSPRYKISDTRSLNFQKRMRKHVF